MKAFIAGLAAMALSACAPATPSEAQVHQDAQAVVQDWARTASEGRWDDLAAFFVEDGLLWVENGAVRYTSRADVAAGAADAKENDISAQVRVSDVKARALGPDAAVVVASITTQFDFAGQPVTQNQILTATLVRHEGRWLFAQGQIAKRAGEAAKR